MADFNNTFFFGLTAHKQLSNKLRQVLFLYFRALSIYHCYLQFWSTKLKQLNFRCILALVRKEKDSNINLEEKKY